jgi:hypothetical protein
MPVVSEETTDDSLVVNNDENDPTPDIPEELPIETQDEVPVTEVVDEVPETEVVDKTPITEVVDETPVIEVVEEVPETEVVDEAPVIEVVDEAPETEVVDEAPVIEVADETPVTEVADETPVTEVADEAPITEVVEEVPETEVVDEAPIIEVADEAPIIEVADETETPIVISDRYEHLDKAQILEKLAEVVDYEISDTVKTEVELLKLAFYKILNAEIDEAKKAFVEEGGLLEEFEPKFDEAEENLKKLLAVFREKKASLATEAEKIKEENLKAKKAIIEQLKNLIESKDDFYKVYNEFRRLQQQWKEIKQVPQTAVNDLWKEFQHYSEKFYDLLKINIEMRDYDFKKNLELKQALCEAVEKLGEEKDIVSAFHHLQKLHQDWREIGPVEKELREEIWTRFKKVSTAINKKHQGHFESLRSLENRNFEEKTALCVEVETIDYSKITSLKDWDSQSKAVLELQEKWKTIGFAPKKHNTKIFDRFRKACDVFFQNKNNFYKGVKSEMETNLEKKKELCEKAEALKDSQDWKETTNKFIDLQKEWKSIGPVSRKHSGLIWKRFISACDTFFEQKNNHFSSRNSEESENLKKKKEIIEKINAIDTKISANEAIIKIRELMAEWNKIGFVPFREKERSQKEYRTAIDKHFDRLKIDGSERRLQSFKSSLNEIASGGEKSKNRLFNEREKLLRTYERLKNDIQTYENNIGFLSVSSKGGGGLVKEMNNKIESLKEELNLIVKKIEVIDENFEKK